MVEGMKAGDKKEGLCLVQYAVYGIHFICRHLEYACFVAIKKNQTQFLSSHIHIRFKE